MLLLGRVGTPALPVLPVRRVLPVLPVLLVLMILLAGCGFLNAGKDTSTAVGSDAPLTVVSSAFAPGAPIPVLFTCNGRNVSPPLQWSGLPAGTGSLALVMSDPDAPGGTFWHWVLFGIDRTATGLGQGGVPAGARHALNSKGRAAYDGPCPPSGTHHYRFTLYALRSPTTMSAGVATQRALAAIRGKALAQGSVVGTFAAG